MYKILCLFLCHICISSISNFELLKKESINGKVVRIIDGDTFKFLKPDSTQIKVRLAHIDCPENKQPFSKKAKTFTSNAIFGKTVTLEVLKKDRYQRYIANVIYDDALNLSHELIKHGLAWHYIKYSKDSILQLLEDNAKNNQIGLWQDPKAIAPWQWRTHKKTK